jgi:DNA-binding response OmpR family regulator
MVLHCLVATMSHKPLRILVVDDNHLMLGLLRLSLEAAGHVAVGVESAALALVEARRDPPDVCIVDEIMPGLSGSDLIRMLRASTDPRLAQMRIIGISGRPGSRESLLASGADGFLPKPIDEGALRATIDGLSPIPASGRGRPIGAASA